MTYEELEPELAVLFDLWTCDSEHFIHNFSSSASSLFVRRTIGRSERKVALIVGRFHHVPMDDGCGAFDECTESLAVIDEGALRIIPFFTLAQVRKDTRERFRVNP